MRQPACQLWFQEPAKSELLHWQQGNGPLPARVAQVIMVAPVAGGSNVPGLSKGCQLISSDRGIEPWLYSPNPRPKQLLLSGLPACQCGTLPGIPTAITVDACITQCPPLAGRTVVHQLVPVSQLLCMRSRCLAAQCTCPHIFSLLHNRFAALLCRRAWQCAGGPCAADTSGP